MVSIESFNFLDCPYKITYSLNPDGTKFELSIEKSCFKHDYIACPELKKKHFTEECKSYLIEDSKKKEYETSRTQRKIRDQIRNHF